MATGTKPEETEIADVAEVIEAAAVVQRKLGYDQQTGEFVA